MILSYSSAIDGRTCIKPRKITSAVNRSGRGQKRLEKIQITESQLSEMSKKCPYHEEISFGAGRARASCAAAIIDISLWCALDKMAADHVTGNTPFITLFSS